MPLGTLVRVPGFKELRCPRATTKPCVLSGSNMFLAESFSATQDFATSIDVAPDFTGTQIVIPHPTNGVLYLKLRDDPATVQTLTMQVTPMPAAEASAIGNAKPVAPAADAPVTDPQDPPDSGAKPAAPKPQ